MQSLSPYENDLERIVSVIRHLAVNVDTQSFSTPGMTIATDGSITIFGSTTPNVKFTPSSGSTKSGQIYQLADDFNIASAGVADWISLNLVSGIATFFGSIDVAAGQFISTNEVIVANLPSASVSGPGARAFVSNATATTFASIVAGGGANRVPVYSDGTNWLIG